LIRTINIAPGVPNSRQAVVLDGREYVLDLRWSQREERWYLDMRDANGVLLAGAVKLVSNWPILYRLRVPGSALPPGELVVTDAREVPADPGLDELGDAVQLVYIDAEDMEALQA
jgi:hypothetical protein